MDSWDITFNEHVIFFFKDVTGGALFKMKKKHH